MPDPSDLPSHIQIGITDDGHVGLSIRLEDGRSFDVFLSAHSAMKLGSKLIDLGEALARKSGHRGNA